MKKKTIILLAVLLLSALTAIHAQTSGTFEGGPKWALSGDGTLTISGNGALPRSLSAGSNSQPWYAVRNQIKAVVVGDGITTMSIDAFDGCTNLVSLDLGKGVTSLSNYMIRGTAITSLTIPEQVTTIESETFMGAAKLETVYFNAVNCTDFVPMYVGPPFRSLDKTPALKTVVIGDAVLRIPEYVFQDIATLTSVTIGKGVTEIAQGAFEGCPNLTSIVIPGNVKTIATDAFGKCIGLTSIELQDGVETFGITAFTGAKVTELTIPPSVTQMRAQAFGNFPRLETVYFNATNCDNPDVDSPFDGSEILTTIIFGDNVRRIPSYFAKNLTGLESVTIGRRITQLGDYTFSGCTYLMEVINNAPRPQAWGWGLFNDVDPAYLVVRVPAAALNAYKNAKDWKDLTIEVQ